LRQEIRSSRENGGGAQDVVTGEEDPLAQLLLQAQLVLILDEVLAQPGRGDVGDDGLGVDAGARGFQGAIVDVGGEQLGLDVDPAVGGLVGEQHGQRIGFLAGGAGRGPDPQSAVIGGELLLEQHGDDVAFQRLEGLAVAEEVGHADQHVGQQCRGFLRVALQIPGIAGHVGQGIDLHAPFDAAQHRGQLVMAEIVAGAGAQRGEDLAQRQLVGLGLGLRLDVVHLARLDRGVLAVLGRRHRAELLEQRLHVAAQFDQLLRDVGHRQNDVDHAGFDGAARHRLELRIAGFLRQGDAALFLDARQPHRTVGTAAGKHDADGVGVVGVGQRAEEQVDGHLHAALALRLGQAQVAVVHRQVQRRGNHVDVVTLDGCRLGDLQHRHAGRLLQDLVGLALVFGREVHDHHEGHAAIGRHAFEQRDKRLEAARRGADTDHGKLQRAAGQVAVLRHGRLRAGTHRILGCIGTSGH